MLNIGEARQAKSPDFQPDAQLGGTSICEDALRLLDEFAGMAAEQVIGPLVPWLHKLKRSLAETEWNLFKQACPYHPVAALVHQDPFTRWSYRKPRGYAGDARLLDFIYGQDVEADLAAATSAGREIYKRTFAAAAPNAVRERRSILSGLVDAAARSSANPIDVLSIAAGRLREAEDSFSLDAGRIRRWVALDQDAESIASIERTQSSQSIEPIVGSAKGLVSGKLNLGIFDLIYSAGLYDYLSHRLAGRLTEATFDMLKPGGTMMYANFARDIPDDGYMEAFMAWHLIFRTEDEMIALADGIPKDQLAHTDIFRGSNRNIIYVVLKRSK
jgi:hypothetical protein